MSRRWCGPSEREIAWQGSERHWIIACQGYHLDKCSNYALRCSLTMIVRSSDKSNLTQSNLGKGGRLFQHFFEEYGSKVLYVSYQKQLKALKAGDLSARNNLKQIRKQAYKSMKWKFFGWLITSVHLVSQKNSAGLFSIGLHLQSRGLSKKGTSDLAKYGLCLPKTTQLRLERNCMFFTPGVFLSPKPFRFATSQWFPIQYSWSVFLIVLEVLAQYEEDMTDIYENFVCCIWIDNYNKFYRHLLFKEDRGFYVNCNFTALAFNKLNMLQSENIFTQPAMLSMTLNTGFVSFCKKQFASWLIVGPQKTPTWNFRSTFKNARATPVCLKSKPKPALTESGGWCLPQGILWGTYHEAQCWFSGRFG